MYERKANKLKKEWHQATKPLKVHKHEFFCDFFCRNRNLMVQRDFENRIRFGRDIRLLNISAHAQHAMKSVPIVCSACDEIRSTYAQCAIKFVPRMLSIDCTCKHVHILPQAEHARKFVPRMLSVR